MAWKGFSKILTESEQPEPIMDLDETINTMCKQIIIQPKRDNTAAIYLGPSAATSLELNVPTEDGAPITPVTLQSGYGNGMDLKTLYVIGTAGDGVQGLYEEY